MSWVSKIPAPLAHALLDAAKVLATHLVSLVSGGDHESNADTIAAMQRRILEGALESAQVEADFMAQQAKNSLAIKALGPLAEDVLAALEHARSIKPLFIESEPDADGTITLTLGGDDALPDAGKDGE